MAEKVKNPDYCCDGIDDDMYGNRNRCKYLQLDESLKHICGKGVKLDDEEIDYRKDIFDCSLREDLNTCKSINSTVAFIFPDNTSIGEKKWYLSLFYFLLFCFLCLFLFVIYYLII